MGFLYIRYNRDSIKYHDFGGFQSRHQALLRLFKAAWDTFPKEEITGFDHFLISSHDSPREYQHGPVPGVRIYPIAGLKDEAMLTSFSCFNFGGWPEARMPDYTQVSRDITMKGREPPKINKLFWIGAITHHYRQQLIQIANMHSQRIEAQTIRWIPRPDGTYYAEPYVSLPDHTTYTRLIDIEGGGYSGRLKLLLFSRRLLFVPDRPWWDVATCRLQPWTHYVPVRRDLSDLLEKLYWADAHPEESQHIIDNAFAYAQEHCTVEASIRHIHNVIIGSRRHGPCELPNLKLTRLV